MIKVATQTLLVSLAATAFAQTYSATYLPTNAPGTTEEGQEGTNKCGTESSQTSICQNAYSAWHSFIIMNLRAWTLVYDVFETR